MRRLKAHLLQQIFWGKVVSFHPIKLSRTTLSNIVFIILHYPIDTKKFKEKTEQMDHLT